MIANLSKLDLRNSLIQKPIEWIGKKVKSFNLKNQTLVIGFGQFFRSMITVTYGLKIDKSIIGIYLVILREYRLCCFVFSELFQFFFEALLKVYRYPLLACCFPL